MPHRTVTAGIVLTLLLCTPLRGGNALLELEVGGTAYVGRSLRHDQEACWLLGQDGRVHRIRLDDVTASRKVADTFQPIARGALGGSLREELGRGYEVRESSKFVVAAPDGAARPYAELLDDVYRAFVRFFSRRSLRLSEPEVPLVAIVFADAGQFADYCRRDGVPFSSGLRGYYEPESNRIALYDPGDGLAATALVPPAGTELFSLREGDVPSPGFGGNAFATIRAGLRDTLVHEATHQLAFNMGLHTRIGENPKWVVEGLALNFEQQMSTRPREAQRPEVNDEFYIWFITRVRPDWKPGTLRAFLAADRSFVTETVNSYSIAWALTYYLSVRRSAEYAAYLHAIRERDVFRGYTAEERVSDFQQAFGADIDWLEVELLRYIDGLGS